MESSAYSTSAIRRAQVSWLERLPVTQEAAGSSTFNDIEEHGRHCKSLEVHHGQRYCVSQCVSRRPLGIMRGGRAAPCCPTITGPGGERLPPCKTFVTAFFSSA